MSNNYKGPLDYIDVAARIVEFREKHPDGALQPADPAQPYRIETISGVGADGKPVEQTFIVVVAAAYRGPQDERPGIGMAYEVFPGRTQFTRGSELQNAETSAWGRAIVAALAADTKKGIASQEEVRNRRAEQEQPQYQHQAAEIVAEADRMDGELQKTKATHNAVRSLRSRIAEHEQANGKDLPTIAAEFALFTGGGADISKAKGPELQKYLRHIGVPLVEGDEQWQTTPEWTI